MAMNLGTRLGIILFLSSVSFAASESGPCDSPYPDAQGNVTFLCRGLTDDQMRLLPNVSTLVNKILVSGVDEGKLETQTDGILKLLQKGAPGAAAVVPAGKVALTPEGVLPPTAKPKKEKPKEKEKETFTYDYRGYKTSSLVGPLIVMGDNGELKEYEKLLALQKAGDWKKLLKDANHEIKKVPEWLTPYAFKGVALMRQGDKDGAMAALDYVDQHSVGNTEYDQVRRLLHQLRPDQP